MKNIKIVPAPSNNEVQKYLVKWDSLENYVLQESALNKLFHETYPANIDINDILIKASALNDFYSTNIFSIFPVAKRILELNIDSRLSSGDLSLVNELSKVEISGVEKHFYSFASKYCSHHNEEEFPIYDDFVHKILIHFKKADHFYDFEESDLKDYAKFRNILIEFREYYQIETFSLKDIDRYLWQLGKEYFPKNYGKKKR